MKNKLNLIFAALSVTAFAACTNEIAPEDKTTVDGAVVERLSACVNEEPDTKVSIGADGGFAWTSGSDNIAVLVSNGTDAKYVTSGGASASAESAEFVISYDKGYSRSAFAVFPSNIVDSEAANYGQDGKGLDVTLPSSYAIEDISGSVTPCPMIADNSGEGLAFRQLCGLLRITVNSIPPTADNLVIEFTENVTGTYTVPAPVEPGISVISSANATGDNSKVITVNFEPYGTWIDKIDLNIPLPTGEYGDITVTAKKGAKTLLTMKRYIKSSGYEATRAHGAKVIASLPAFAITSDGNSRVAIAPGNLKGTGTTEVADASNWTYSFHENQYGCLYTTSQAVDKMNRDFFSWYEMMSEDEVTSRTFNIAGIDWVLPSQAEVQQLTKTPNSFVKVKIPRSLQDLGDKGGTYGIVFFPVSWDVALSAGLSTLNNTGANFTEISEDTYFKFIDAGAVFLPAAGRLDSFTEIKAIGTYVHWMTSTKRDDENYRELQVHGSGMPDGYASLTRHPSVRLIRKDFN